MANSDIIKIGFDYRASLAQFEKETNGVFDGISNKAGKQKITIQLDAKDDKVIDKIKELQKLKLDKFTFEFGDSGLKEQLQTFDKLETKINEIINLSKGINNNLGQINNGNALKAELDLYHMTEKRKVSYDEIINTALENTQTGNYIINLKNQYGLNEFEIQNFRDLLKMNDLVNHPEHYQGKVECIDCIESAVSGLDGFHGFCAGNAIKYIFRFSHKNGVEDLRKAEWYIDRLIKAIPGRHA